MVVLSLILVSSQVFCQACQYAVGKFSTLFFFKSSFNFTCLSETLLDSSIQLDHPGLVMDKYTLVRNDHPDNVKRGEVCIYYKNCFPLRVLKISRLYECLILEINEKSVILR